MDINKLFEMNEEELELYLQTEVEKVIASAPEHKRDQLWAVHNRARMAAASGKNPVDSMIKCNEVMWESFFKLNEALKNV